MIPYDSLREQILGKTGRRTRKLANNTYGRLEGDGTYQGDRAIVRLHATDIVDADPDGTRYSTGGWWTATTRERINRYMPWGVAVRQRDNVWRVFDGSERMGRPEFVSRFYEGITFDERGQIVGKVEPDDDPDKAMRKRIDRYARLYTADKLRESYESGAWRGDSWGELTDGEGKPIMRTTREDYESYMDDEYVMLGLARNALRFVGYPEYLSLVLAQPVGNRYEDTTIRRAVRRYMTDKLIDGPGGR